MIYEIDFKVKTEANKEEFLCIPFFCGAQCYDDLEEIIKESTGLKWAEGDNGLCIEVIPHIEKGLIEFYNNSDKYREILKNKSYDESKVSLCIEEAIDFFTILLGEWERFTDNFPDLVLNAYFYIEFIN